MIIELTIKFESVCFALCISIQSIASRYLNKILAYTVQKITYEALALHKVFSGHAGVDFIIIHLIVQITSLRLEGLQLSDNVLVSRDVRKWITSSSALKCLDINHCSFHVDFYSHPETASPSETEVKQYETSLLV